MKPYFDSGGVTIYHGDAWEVVKALPDISVQTVVTSPPYWGLRDYGDNGQFGLEKTPEEYVERLVLLFRDLRRVLRDDGTAWLNLGDSYAGSWGAQSRGDGYAEPQNNSRSWQIEAHPKTTRTGSMDRIPGLKPKDLVGIPWRVAFALQADGWYLRSDIIWSKPNPMPESVTDRPTKAHEYIFLLSKSARYYYDAEAIKESTVGGDAGNGFDRPHRLKHTNGNSETYIDIGRRNKRTVWHVATQPYPEAHFATFPPKLIEPCILAGCPKGGVVLDPFHGSGTTGEVARRAGRNYVGIELNACYIEMSMKRYQQHELFRVP